VATPALLITTSPVMGTVTNAKLANMATRTVKANATSGSANPTDVVMADGDFLIANGSALVTVPITGDVVISNAGVATIQTDAVDIAMLSASGTASSSTFLAGNNAWAAAGGGSLTLINTAAASNSATLTVTGLSTTYDTFIIVLSDLVPADNKDLRFMIGDSGGIDDGGSDYECHTQTVTSTSTSYSSIANTSIGFIPLGADVGNDAGDGLSALLVLNNADSSTMRPTISGTVAYLSDSENVIGGTVLGQRKAVIAVTQVQIKFSTGNIVRGRMTVWGLAHA